MHYMGNLNTLTLKMTLKTCYNTLKCLSQSIGNIQSLEFLMCHITRSLVYLLIKIISAIINFRYFNKSLSNKLKILSLNMEFVISSFIALSTAINRYFCRRVLCFIRTHIHLTYAYIHIRMNLYTYLYIINSLLLL